MSHAVLDRATTARQHGAPNWDRLLVTDGLAAVVDGTTRKPWHVGSLVGGGVADHVVLALRGLGGGESADDVVEQVSTKVAVAKAAANCSPSEGGAATMAIVLFGSRVVLRVGDPWVRIGHEVHPPNVRADQLVAGARALMAEHALSTGMSIPELRSTDTSREAVLPLLKAAEELRNHPTSELAYGAVDGSSIPGRFIECWQLPNAATEVTLASDGYPRLEADLQSSERALIARLDRDPLMIADPPSTKGSPAIGASFDDRSFLRLTVSAR